MNNQRKNPLFLPSLLCFLFLSFKTHVTVFAADTISLGDSLTGGETITSKDDNFVLGFFSPGNSQNHYIGIWYKKVSLQTVVWVANRDKPVSDPSTSKLTLLGNGDLVIINQTDKSPIWSTNSASNTLNATEAVLGDDGNLVLRDGSNPSVVIWQSFDYPTDTWLPGGKLGLNKRTKETQLLASWRNLEDPAPGIFNLELDPNGTSQYLIRWNKSIQVWTSGEWNQQSRTFTLVPEMRLNYIYNFSYISNENESYFTYSLYNNSIISRFVMDLSGQIKQFTWSNTTKRWNLFWSQPKQLCDVYGICGAFGNCNQDTLKCECLPGFVERSPADWNLQDSTGGCVRNTSLQCRNTDGFSSMPTSNLPDNPQSAQVNSVEECKSACEGTCSCNAYAYTDSGCNLWNGVMLNVKQQSDGGAGSLYLKRAASEIPISAADGKRNKKSFKVPVVGAIAGVVAILALGLVLVLICRSKRSVGKSKTVDGTLVAFAYRELQSATKNFSQKLGGGGFGSVFKGALSDSTAIAVKKLEGLSQGEKQFRSEVSTIGTIQHVNLVRLRGFCSEGAKRLLVYDFMAKGSLDANLFHQNDPMVLDWKTRYQIALGTARGLAYLHEKCRDCIIHCDIKPENILLDAECCPKVADFGLAKLVGRDFSRVLTTMRGTRGYLAPEWISGVAITPKADVYSYGMMLFEIISGKRNAEHNDEKIRFFPTWAATKMHEGEDIISLLDNRLEGNADIQELTRACRVACWCIQDDEAHRPSMGQVVQILEGVSEVNAPPIPRSLHVLVENQDNVFFFSESSNGNSHELSNTTSSTSSHAKSTISSTSSKS
ncbi:hypothetical protein MKX01_037407 [Papaver californicum]|nr:hypothetical protein MKX01_037407 [Papaver californicum]